MPLYRTHITLSRATTNKPSIPAGTISDLADVPQDKIVVLLERGKVSRVSAPPLGVMPQYEGYAERLTKRGVITLEDFILADTRELARWLSMKQAEVETLKARMRSSLTPPAPLGG